MIRWTLDSLLSLSWLGGPPLHFFQVLIYLNPKKFISLSPNLLSVSSIAPPVSPCVLAIYLHKYEWSTHTSSRSYLTFPAAVLPPLPTSFCSLFNKFHINHLPPLSIALYPTMTTAPPSNSRASLLAGLRTGGVRTTSSSIPHTAAPGGSFNVPRFASQNHGSIFPEEESEYDQVAEMQPQYSFPAHGGMRGMPMTAAVDGPNNRFSQQQRGMNPNSLPFSPGPNMMGQTNQAQAQAFQLQMMQLELLKIQVFYISPLSFHISPSVQAVQAQQYQAEVLAQAQRQQQSQAQNRRASFNPPATAGPLSTSFDLRSATLSAQMRRANQGEQVRQLGVASDDQVPMTAALGGKFGSRSVSLSTQPRFDNENPPPTPGGTTVISGGTSLGNPSSNNISNSTAATNPNAPSKSDSAVSWRRGGKNNSVLSGNNRAVTSPSVKVTPPPIDPVERVSPPPAEPTHTTAAPKFRPQPLRFSVAAQQPLPAVAIDSSDSATDNDDGYSTSSSKSAASNSGSSPTTPRSSSSNEMPLSPREEASKKLYEGLGIGRPRSALSSDGGNANGTPIVAINGVVEPAPQVSYSLPTASVMASHRMVSQPMRQPRGPPSGLEELGPKNFATRIRRQAIGGLGMLMGARERREFVEAY